MTLEIEGIPYLILFGNASIVLRKQSPPFDQYYLFPGKRCTCIRYTDKSCIHERALREVGEKIRDCLTHATPPIISELGPGSQRELDEDRRLGSGRGLPVSQVTSGWE